MGPCNSRPVTPVEAQHEMCPIAGGVLRMGSGPDDPDAEPEERPLHERRIAPFYLDRFPVTVARYAAFLAAADRPPPLYWRDARFRGPEQPVVGVSWHDAQAFCAWAGLRLPTEAEREWAARGPRHYRYPWGNRFQLHRCAQRNLMAGPAPVGSFAESASPFGVEELVGNLAEWTADAYAPDAYAARAAGRPGPSGADTAYRVVRGGGWLLDARTARCARRVGVWAPFREAHLGFRCARDAVPTPV